MRLAAFLAQREGQGWGQGCHGCEFASGARVLCSPGPALRDGRCLPHGDVSSIWDIGLILTIVEPLVVRWRRDERCCTSATCLPTPCCQHDVLLRAVLTFHAPLVVRKCCLCKRSAAPMCMPTIYCVCASRCPHQSGQTTHRPPARPCCSTPAAAHPHACMHTPSHLPTAALVQ